VQGLCQQAVLVQPQQQAEVLSAAALAAAELASAGSCWWAGMVAVLALWADMWWV
jgi:hypothetical protein